MGYLYPNAKAAPNRFGLLTSDANTVEIYGKLGVDAPLSPELSVYYDVDKIKGAYLEAGISYSLAASENVSIDLAAFAGFSAGRGVPDNPASDELSDYADDGFTHLDLSAAVPFSAGPLSLSPALHVVINGDDATKVTSPTNIDKGAKLWGGVTISWSKTLGEEPEEATEAE